MKNITGIYQIKNVVDGKAYIGSSKAIGTRFRNHLYLLRRGDHPCPKLRHAWNKHGEANFVFEVLEECELKKEVLLAREQHYLDALKPEYNCDKRAGSRLGSKHSPETIEKIRRAKQAKPRTWTEEDRAAQSERMKGTARSQGYHHTEEAKLRIKEWQKANPRATITEELKKRWQDEGRREIARKQMNVRFQDPSYRASVAATLHAIRPSPEQTREMMKEKWKDPAFRQMMADARAKKKLAREENPK